MATMISLALCVFMASIVSGQVLVEPPRAVIVSGSNVSMLCKVSYAINSCRVRVGKITHNLSSQKRDPSLAINYFGNGIQAGECGVSIRRVDEEMNGNITCYVPSQVDTAELEGTMELVIARAPAEPVLTFSSSGIFMAGDVLKASCEVPHGRPPATISWYLGDEQLLAGLHQKVTKDEPNSDLKTVSQNLTRDLVPDDDKVTLTCKAEHEALPLPLKAQRQINVQYPPQSSENQITTIFGVKLREDGLLNVTIRANPQPRVLWTVGNVRLEAGERDHEDKFEARHLQPMGSGYYVASLLVRSVEKADVDRQYVLEAKNEHGAKLFPVKISTSVEPEAVQLDAGSIVGIVVGVLALVAAIALVLYAKVTHRWCFIRAGEGAENRTRSSGESSDTESAVAGPKTERRRLPDLSRALPALRSVLPSRGRKDKVVEATPDPKPADEEPLQEGEKKSVVYAELALATPATAAPPKPAPDSTEYAEIGFGSQPSDPQQKPPQA